MWTARHETGLPTCSRGNTGSRQRHGLRRVWKSHRRQIRPDGTHQVLVDNDRGKLLNGPNDVWINPTNGGMYVTDPIFPRPYWDADDPRQQPWEPTHSEQAPQGKGGYVYSLPSTE